MGKDGNGKRYGVEGKEIGRRNRREKRRRRRKGNGRKNERDKRKREARSLAAGCDVLAPPLVKSRNRSGR